MNSRIIKAIVIAPLSVFPLMTVLAFSLGAAAPIIGLIAVAVAYIGMLVIGVPAMLLLRRYQATQWWQLTLAGAIGAACACWVVDKQPMSPTSISAGAFGALVAGVAWCIAFRRLPKHEADLEQPRIPS